MTRPKEELGPPGSWLEDRTVPTLGDDLAAIDALLAGLRPAWHAQAACRGQGPPAWFPLRGDDVRVALSVCETCPVRQPCAEAGRDEPMGIWGGLSRLGRAPARRAAAQERQAARQARNAEIVRLRGVGRSLREIAAAVDVSVHTVQDVLDRWRDAERAATQAG